MGYNEKYNQKVGEAWQHLIDGEEFDFSCVRPEIYESWVRSKNYNVNPYLTKTEILGENELNVRINNNMKLIEIVRPYIENLYSIVKNSGYYILFCDNQGYILDMLGDEAMMEAGKKSLLVVGANRSEEFAGTNAIGTALVLNKPIQMVGEEHFMKPHKKYVCSCAPIEDATGKPIGALVLTGLKEEAHIHTLGMVMSAVDGISKELRILNAYDEIEMISAQRNSIIETIPSGLLLLNENKRIIQINTNALNMLNKKYSDLIGKNFLEILNPNPYAGQNKIGLPSKETYNVETDLYLDGSDSPPKKLNMSVNFVVDNLGRKKGTVVRFNEAKKINALVNRIGGYKSIYTFDSIEGESAAVKTVVETARKAAKNDSNVLILGESGTGKELIAQAIHSASSFSGGPFVAINCGALPKGLIESELFGYEKGAFTGANREGNPGKFELADGGTIFLDEIGDMPFDIQAALLRVLQTREVLRIGAKYPKSINVRVIAATNCDLKKAIEDKTFRDDLYYRLNVLSIHVAPLRERGEDVILLAKKFISSYNMNKHTNYVLSEDVLLMLQNYSWPGNIRELENIMERAINVTDGSIIGPESLPKYVSEHEMTTVRKEKVSDDSVEEGMRIGEIMGRKDIASVNKQLIMETLSGTNGNCKLAAELLGISRRTIYRKMNIYGIEPKKFKS